ncbi:MAG: helix-turn-helix domain-containing protein [Deltaproteobacteria bacterium]|nr:helix-turn-helix domain-containing protein [Deltaproteobacteria bacterium]MBW2360737.1 helix-turn-helix domain-containing protein [Deltaproteobacteria bacterium]
MRRNPALSNLGPAARGASPPTERVVAVLELLAASDTPALSGAEITRRLGLQKSTCHGILKSLQECGYLARSSSDRTYSLGPTLIALGRAAGSRFQVTRAARPALDELHRVLGLGCALATIDEGSLAVVDRVGGDELFPTGLQIGDRFPLVAPYGAVLRAWDDSDTWRTWLEGAPDLGTAQVRRLRRALGTIRKCGYGAWEIADMASRLAELHATVRALRESPRGEGLRITLVQAFAGLARGSDVITSRVGRERVSVGIAAAPVFDERGRAAHEVELHVYRENLRVVEFEQMMERLLATAEEITHAVGGSWRIGGNAGASA